MLALRTLSKEARQVIIGGLGRWLPSHIAMRFREIQGFDHSDPLDDLIAHGLLITARNKEEFFEIFGMAEMMVKCQEISVDRGSMARFFVAVGHALYTTRQGSECSVEYGHNIVFTLAQEEQHQALTLSQNGMCVCCRKSVGMDMKDNPSDHGPIHAKQPGCSVDYKVDPSHIASEEIRSLADREVQTDLYIRSREDREVQTDLHIRDACQVIHSDSDGSELGLHAALYIDDVHPAMQPVSMDHQADSDIVAQHHDGHGTNTVGCQSDSKSFIYTSSHVSEAGRHAEIIIGESQPSMDIVAVAVDLQSESHLVLHSDGDGICTSTVGSIPGES
jgi:hypothetical protein